METLRTAFHRRSTRSYRALHMVIGVLIAVSVTIFVIELLSGGPLPLWLERLDRAILWLFAVELILRVSSFRPPRLDLEEVGAANRIRHHLLGRLGFMLRPMILIDLLTVSALFPALRGLRALRLLRLARTPFRYSSPLQSVAQAFRDNALLYLLALSFVLVAVLLGGVSFYLVERAVDPTLSVADGIWWALVTLTTVGFGDIAPSTLLGRAIGAVLMLTGMLSLALFAGVVGQSLVQSILTIRKEQFRMSGHINHLVVCGYEPGMEMLLQAIRSEIDLDETPLVLFAPGDRPRDLPPELVWVDGDPTKESELAKARIGEARAVIVTGSRTILPQSADAKTILTVFTIRSWMDKQAVNAARKRPLHIVVEILDEENIEHARSAGADEVIETTHVGFSLLSHAVAVPGSASVLARIASAEGQSLFVGAPGRHDGKSFAEAAAEAQREYEVLVVGVRQGNGVDRLNPPPRQILGAADSITYLAAGEVASL